MRWFSIVVLAALVSACASVGRGGGRDAVVAVTRNYANERDFSGVTLIVDADGSRFFADARGLADRHTGAGVRANTRFQIASISKLFVAAAVLREVDQGRVALDAPISRYLPDIPPRLGATSVSSLMQHTSGLRRESAFEATETLTVAEHVGRLTDSEFTSELGAYSYSNTGYVLLARIVEVVSGLPFDVALQREVLAPAGLENTGFIVADDVIPNLAIGYARSRDGWRVPPRARHRGVYPPGGLYSTADDLARFMSALAGGGLLSAESTRALFAARVPVGEGTQMASYAGVMTARNGESYVLVAGSADGGKAVLMREMNARRTIVILSNVGDVPITEMLRDVVVASEGGTPTPPMPCRLSNSATYAARAGQYDFTGTGLNRATGVDRYRVDLTLDGDRAFLWDDNDQSVTLLCEREPGVLTPSYTDDIRVRFEGSERTVMVFEWDANIYRAQRIEP